METLASFRNIHAGETLIVCGCGESLNDLSHSEQFITIGVNDLGRRFHPNYLVVVNPRQQFSGDRFHYVETSQAEYLFTQLDLGVPHPHVVKFRLGTRGGTDFSNPQVLHYTQNSPYVALCLAVHMGATRIGLIGVDFTDHHFFAQTGTHPLVRQLATIDAQYRRLGEALRVQGVEVFNLSRTSRLTAFPTRSIDDFWALAKPVAGLRGASASLRIVSYATTPVAGVPAILARCIRARTSHTGRCVWAQKGYGNGVIFEGDIQWKESPVDAVAALAGADVVIVHNGKVEPRHRSLLAGKAVITMAHNYMWNVDQALVRQGFPGVVVGQYQATLPEFKDWRAVPNPVPLWESGFQPEPKGPVVTVCYTPSGKHESYSAGHRLYWHAKGYFTTIRVLDRLAKRFPLRLEVIRGSQVSHAQSLAMKRRAHIVIDECVTGSYHRNSLEGLAAGCVVVNALGLLPAIADAFQYCAGDAADLPFVRASLDDLEAILLSLVERGPKALAVEGARNRHWMEEHWNFTRQWERFWMPVIDQAMQRANRQFTHTRGHCNPQSAIGAPMLKGQGDMKRLKEGVSVIIPHGGQERLPHLTATLVNLHQCQGVSEVIVVEMGNAPMAEDLARRWAHKYVFVHSQDVFERARTLNVGTPFAEYDLLLWKDNDLLLPADFISRAAAELRSRQLDYLIPYTSIRYLSEFDSKEVVSGTCNPADCKPVRVLNAGRDVSGGMGLVKQTFVRQYGGMHEGFRGWGGEDNAWSYKARLLGRTGITQRSDQHIYHLFHPDSAGYGGSSHIAHNPYYADNVAILNRMHTIRDRRRFLECFPPPAYYSCPWAREKYLVFITDGEGTRAHDLMTPIIKSLVDLYGLKVELQPPHWLEQCHDSGALSADVIVLFGVALVQQFMSNAELEPLWRKALLVVDSDAALTAATVQQLGRGGAVLALNPQVAQVLQAAGLRPWTLTALTGDGGDGMQAALTLTQPLSIILGGGEPGPVDDLRPVSVPESGDRHRTLPVWLYWEGECPEWIQACQRTISAHAPDARLLTPETFAQLWDVDRDIDLTRLIAAHRADFIRAFLLARYGGLWIDSDCLVMQSLQPIVDAVWEHDFLGHRERSGYVPNGFIGARPGSQIAAAFYRRICAILRSGQPLGWISLGGQPLTKIINTGRVPWYQITCERIQPICWSEPGAFFAVRDHTEHDRMFDEHAICYMLSNRAIQQYQAAHPRQNLLDEGTFFRYLLHKALNEEKPVMPSKQPVQSLHDWQLIPFCLEALLDISPRRVLEVGVGLGRWGLFIREYCEAQQGRGRREDWQCYLEGIVSTAEYSREHLGAFYHQIHCGDAATLLASMTDQWNLVIFGVALAQWPKETAERALHRALALSDYVLVNTLLAERQNGHHNEEARTDWSFSDLVSLGQVRYAIECNRPGLTQGAFLLSREDPRQLRRATSMEQVFTKIFHSNRRIGDESVSGPGSSLAQTAEIRQRLPLLFEDLKIRSLLHAGCGDFHWMRQLALGIDEHIGVDVVQELVQQNQQIYGGSKRRFIKLDVTRDHLPQVDLIFCRDCLVHFPFREAFNALRNFKKSKSTYLLTTTFTGARPNIEIATGGWRPLNLQLPPFNLPPPLKIINEKCTEANGIYADKSLGLWRLEDLVLL